jgi:hypothetical protein
LLFACFLAMNASLWGQDAAAVHGIPGYLNPKTGIFHATPPPPAPDAADPPATTTFTGKIVVNFTITVSSVFASTRQLVCVASASVFDLSNFNSIFETGATGVPRGTGTTVPCSVTIPYSWKLAAGPSDTINLGYSVISLDDPTTPLVLFPQRTSTQRLATIPVPSSGTTTTRAVGVRI